MSKHVGTTGLESLDKIILKCPKCPKCPRDVMSVWHKQQKKEDQINDLL